MKIKTILMVAAIAALTSLTCLAQSATNSPAGTIFNSIEGYFTSFNPDYSWTNVTFEVDTGYAQVTGVNASSKLNLQYDINKFDVGVSMQFSGVGSAVNAEEAQVGYAVVEYEDTKVDAFLRAGYDDTSRGAVIEPGISLKKKLTPNTYAETAISFPIYTAQTFVKTPTIYIGVGFTF